MLYWDISGLFRGKDSFEGLVEGIHCMFAAHEEIDCRVKGLLKIHMTI